MRINPKWAPGWTRLGEALAERGDVDEAMEALSKALGHNPDSYPAYRAMARLYYDNGQPQQAVLAWERALRLRPQHGASHLELAEALLAAGRVDEARGHAETASRLGTDASSLLQGIARAEAESS